MPITQKDIEIYIGHEILEKLDLIKRIKDLEEQLTQKTIPQTSNKLTPESDPDVEQPALTPTDAKDIITCEKS